MDSQKELKRIKGIVTRASQPKPDRYGVQLDGHDNWYNGFGTNPFNEDDTADFEYEETNTGDRTYRNIRKIQTILDTSINPTPADEIMAKSLVPKDKKEPVWYQSLKEDKDRYIEIMRFAVDICMKKSDAKNSLDTTKEVEAIFIRLCIVLGMETPK